MKKIILLISQCLLRLIRNKKTMYVVIKREVMTNAEIHTAIGQIRNINNKIKVRVGVKEVNDPFIKRTIIVGISNFFVQEKNVSAMNGIRKRYEYDPAYKGNISFIISNEAPHEVESIYYNKAIDFDHWRGLK